MLVLSVALIDRVLSIDNFKDERMIKVFKGLVINEIYKHESECEKDE